MVYDILPIVIGLGQLVLVIVDRCGHLSQSGGGSEAAQEEASV